MMRCLSEGGGLLLLTVLCILAASSSAQQDPTYAILAPKIMRPNTDYVVSVTLYKQASQANFAAKLQNQQTNDTLVAKSLDLQTTNEPKTDRISLKIPEMVSGSSYLLIVTGSGGVSFSQNHSVQVSTKTLSVFVQTDKAMYKPGQTILFRAIVLDPNLKPYKGEVNITVYDNAGNKLRQWLGQKNDTGVVNQQLKISDQTNVGDWIIEVVALGNKYKKMITIAEYVLPKFEVKVDLPSYYFVNINNKAMQKDLPISVTAKYTYGKQVSGKLNITVQVVPYSYETNTKYKTINMNGLSLVNGVVQKTVTIKELLDLVPLSYTPTEYWTVLNYRSILVSASVLEEATGIILAGNETVACTSNRYKMEFSSITPNNYKPGLTFYAFLQLKQYDESAPILSHITNEKGEFREINVTVTRTYNYTLNRKPNISNILVPITESGYMMFSLDIDVNIISVNLQAQFVDIEANTSVQTYKYLSPFNSRDNQGAQISMEGSNGVIEPNTVVKFILKTTVPTTIFSYQILNKGAIVMTRTVVQTSARNEHTFELDVTNALAQLLSPSASIVVWYISDGGEVISDSLKVTVNGAFANQVSMTFDKETVAPADTVSLTVNADAGSFIGILAVDKSVLLLRSGNDITKDMVKEDLESYGSNSGQIYYDGPVRGGGIAGPINRKKRSIWIGWPIYLGGTDTSSLLDNAGLFIMTDAYVYSPQINFAPGPPLLGGERGPVGAPGMPGIAGAPAGPSGPVAGGAGGMNGVSQDGGLMEPTAIRMEFPETWLWSDQKSGSGNSAILTAKVPDTITSWVASAFAVSDVSGLGIADNQAQVTVFQPFFISANLPYSIIRGEEFAMKITIFNYMTEDMTVRVTLQKSDFFKVRLPNSVKAQSVSAAATIKVPSNQAVTVAYWIVAESLGQIPIEVKAQSPVAADAIVRKLLVKPEGIEQTYSSSLFLQLPANSEAVTKKLTVSLPPKGVLVPDSQYLECTVIGDLMGPSIEGLENLLRMPSGCGEQNMLSLAPDVYIIHYLKATAQDSPAIMKKAIDFMLAGYQRELTYQRKDGSVSAFGEQDMSGSTWLTSFVMKVFRQASDYIPVEDDKLNQMVTWVINQQNSDGSFTEPGRVIHSDMQGGASKGVALTAYVLIALQENKKNDPKPRNLDTAIEKARAFLEGKLSSLRDDPYALSIVAYALTRVKSSKASEALQAVVSKAITEDGMSHVEKPKDSPVSEDEVIGLDGAAVMWRKPYIQSPSVDIELNSYILLTIMESGGITDGLPYAKWIISQRNSFGGFASTQDTVLGLEALASFAAKASGPSDGPGLTVVAKAGGAESQFETIKRVNALIVQKFQLPDDAEEVEITASGQGTALVQLNVKYNVYQVQNDNGIKLDLKTTSEGNEVTVNSCGSWTRDKESGMVILEVQLLTGYEVVNLESIKKQAGGQIMKVESDGQKIALYFNELTKIPTCVDIVSQRTMEVNNVRNSTVQLYRYYDTKAANIMLYKPGPTQDMEFCTMCPDCCSAEMQASTDGDGNSATPTQFTISQFLLTLSASLLFVFLY